MLPKNYFLLFCLITVFDAALARSSLAMQLLSDLPAVKTSFNLDLLPVATNKDLLVYKNATLEAAPIMEIARRNSEGVYEHVGSFSEHTSRDVNTNGRWIRLKSSYPAVVLFNMAENNTISGESTIPTLDGFLLSDDTLVGFDPSPDQLDGKYRIRTYRHDNGLHQWKAIPFAELAIEFSVKFLGETSSYHVTDTHLAILDEMGQPNNVTVKIYERLSDLSWSLVDTVRVNYSASATFAGVTFNGLDTLVYFMVAQDGNSIGITFIYTKINGQWIEQKFTAESVGYRPYGYLGMSVAFLDANTVLLSAGTEGFTSQSPSYTAGKVLMLARDSERGLWEPMMDLTGPGIFGMGVGVNDYHVVVPSLLIPYNTLTYYVLPRCFYQPINVTCHDLRIEDCSALQNTTGLYTVNNPECGEISAKTDSVTLVNNKTLEAQFSFARYAMEYTCTATVTCPAPVAPHAAPVKEDCTATLTCPQAPTRDNNISKGTTILFNAVALIIALSCTIVI